jgi:uncharacterized protein YqeY
MATGEVATRIQQATVAAMKARDKVRLGVLRMLQSEIKRIEIDTREELDDNGVLGVLSTYCRKVKDQISSSRDAGRDDLVAKAENELTIVSEFMPAELSDAELVQVITDTIAEIGASGPKDMGRVMKAVLPKVAGQAEGGRVSALVKQQLSQ